MQFEKFTERARKVVELATQASTQLGDTSTNTVHLLLGMVEEGSGVAGKVLIENGVTVDGIHQAYQAMGSDSDVSLGEVESSCLVEAEWFNHRYAGTEHLLLGVCTLSNCRAAKLLTSIGKSPVALCRVVVELLGHGDAWDRWLSDHPQMTES